MGTTTRDKQPEFRMHQLSGELGAFAAFAAFAFVACGGSSVAAEASGGRGGGDASCTLGDTRACVGPGACRGGQTCSSSHWGDCDCGDTSGRGGRDSGMSSSGMSSSGGTDAGGGSVAKGGTAAGGEGSAGSNVGGASGGHAEGGESGGIGQAGAAACEVVNDDPMNCGACGHVCGSNECRNGACSTRVFVSSKSYPGNLGGLEGGDAICQSLATAANLGGKFMAWLGTNVTLLKSRMYHSPAPYRRLDGVLLANNWQDLTDGAIAAPLIVDEFGNFVNAGFAWSGTSIDGGNLGFNCDGWLGGSQSMGRVGSVTEPKLWQEAGLRNCGDYQGRLFCFEITSQP